MLLHMCYSYRVCLYFNDTTTTEIYTYLHTRSLHNALPIARTVVAGFGQLDLDPTEPAAEFPGQREALGRLARGDGAAGIALDLIFSAEGEVAFDRREPARDARDRKSTRLNSSH